MNATYENIRIKETTKARLFKAKKSHKDSYDDVINRLLDAHPEVAHANPQP